MNKLSFYVVCYNQKLYTGIVPLSITILNFQYWGGDLKNLVKYKMPRQP